MNEPRPRAVLLVAIAAFTGCAAGPDYVAPQAPQVKRYTPEDPATLPAGAGAVVQTLVPGQAVVPRWWQAFGSPALDALVTQALAASPTLDSARATLEQARASLVATLGAAGPLVEIDGGVARANGNGTRSGGSTANAFTLGPAASFTPDLFGANARRVEQAQALVGVAQAQWHAAALALAGNTVLQAVTLAGVLEQSAALRDIVSVDESNLALVQLAADAGKAARLDVLTAQSQLASDRALLPPLQQQASAARHALALLAGRDSSEEALPDFDLRTLTAPASLPLTLPSALVRQRPDIVAAEMQLRAASAAIGIAQAQLYPSVTLSAGWSAAASTLGGLFGAGSDVWSLAANLVAPVFDGHRLAAQRDAAVQAHAAQLAAYRQVVLQAFAQVADTLEALRHDAALVDAQQQALSAAQETLDLTRQSYAAGQAGLLQLLQAQRLYQQARLGQARALGERVSDSAQLFIVLGGAAPEAAATP